jgi:hypothetical protein
MLAFRARCRGVQPNPIKSTKTDYIFCVQKPIPNSKKNIQNFNPKTIPNFNPKTVQKKRVSKHDIKKIGRKSDAKLDALISGKIRREDSDFCW